MRMLKPMHRTPAAKAMERAKPEVFPKPGSTWRPWHKTPHGHNGPVSIRKFIARAGKDGQQK